MSTISSSTTSTTAYKVTADTTGTLVIQTGATPTTAVTVDASQNVGIGTNSPRNKSDTVGNIGIYSSVASSVGSPLGAQLYIGDSNYNTSNYYNAAPGIGAVYDATYASAAALAFYTFAGSLNSRTERMRIDSSGNVGIGAASPTSTTKFYVEQSAGNVLGYFNSTAASQNARVRINSTDTASSVAYVWSYSNASLNKQASIYLTNTGALATQVGQTAGAEPTAGTTAMVIDSSGNVGIGTSSPTGYGNVNLNLNSSGDTMIHMTNTTSGTASSDGFDILLTGLNAQLINREAGYVSVYTSNTERMRIDSSGNLQFNSGYGSVATGYGCRAWVNFNGTGTIAIRASGNVSSITDGGVGIYRVNFTSSMPDANFTTVASSAGAGSVNNSTTAMLVNATSGTGQTANVAYVDVWCYHPGNQVAQDDAYINVSVFR